jgi:hypothetical protein
MEEITNKLVNLEEKINLINQNTQFSINLFIGILGIAIAIAGVALYKLAKMWVAENVDKELREIRKELNDLKNENIELNKKLSKVVSGGGYGGNGFTHLGDGTHICYLKYNVSISYSCVLDYVFPCAFEDDSQVIPTVNVLNNKNIVATIEKVRAGGISILFQNVNNLNSAEEFEVSIIAIGKFNKTKEII